MECVRNGIPLTEYGKRAKGLFSFLARRCIRPEDRIEYDISLFEGSKERRGLIFQIIGV